MNTNLCAKIRRLYTKTVKITPRLHNVYLQRGPQLFCIGQATSHREAEWQRTQLTTALTHIIEAEA